MQRFKNGLRWINVLVIFATFIAYLSPYFSPEKYWIFSLFGLAYPVLLLANILFLIFWGVVRKWYFFLSLGCIILGWGHLQSLIGMNLMSSNNAKNEVTVMSYNIHGLRYLREKKDKGIRKEREINFSEWVKKYDHVDILLAQEFGWHLRFQDSLKLPYRHKMPPKTASILSKYPIINKGEISFLKSWNSALWADLDLGKNKIIRVYSLHLQSSQIRTKEIDRVVEGNIKEKETWVGIKGVLSKFKNASAIRAKQAEMVMEHISKSPYPVIVGGDFNETPLSYPYHLFSTKLKDAFRVKGKGLGSTYAGKIPALKIDYIFTDPRIKILDYEIERVPFSDHYPVISNIVIPDK